MVLTLAPFLLGKKTTTEQNSYGDSIQFLLQGGSIEFLFVKDTISTFQPSATFYYLLLQEGQFQGKKHANCCRYGQLLQQKFICQGFWEGIFYIISKVVFKKKKEKQRQLCRIHQKIVIQYRFWSKIRTQRKIRRIRTLFMGGGNQKSSRNYSFHVIYGEG